MNGRWSDRIHSIDWLVKKLWLLPKWLKKGGMSIIANELDDLAVKYGTDKCPQIKHTYTPYYYELLKGKRESIKKVLEIGAGEGAGLRMWRDFFPNAMIYGADNQADRIFKEDRIEVIKTDQSSRQDLKNLIAKTGTDIDLVIDDGSHVPEHQVFTCLTLMPLLKRDVIYIIEDVLDPSIQDQLSKYDCVVPKLEPATSRGWKFDVNPSNRLIIVKNPMLIDVYSNMYNEETMLPYFLRHYETIADRIFVWDVGSTDGTRKILARHPKVTILPVEKHGNRDVYWITSLFPQYEKYSSGVSDWVIIADADEFVYHPNLREVLEKAQEQGWLILQCEGFTMVSDKFPVSDGQIYEEIKTGLSDRHESKWTIHSSSARVRYSKGRHGRPIVGDSVFDGRTGRNSGIKMLHYRYLGKEFIKRREMRNIDGTNIAHPGHHWPYKLDGPRTMPDGEKIAIFEWLDKHKGNVVNVVDYS